MSISLAALVCTLALPVRVSEIHLWTQAETVNKCKVVIFQRIAKFIPLIMASSSVRLICWDSFAGCNQQAFSTTAPSYTSDTPVARELASTHTLRVWLSTHHLPRAGSSLCTLVRTSLIMGVVNFVIPSSGDIRCSLLDERHNYTKPSIYGKVLNQFAA